jgi:hypothetical protein
MALIENENTGNFVQFVRIMGGKFVTNAPEGKGISRVNKRGNTVWEYKHGAIEGYLDSIEVNDKGYEGSEQAILILLDAGEKLILQIDTNSGVFRSLSKRFPNINPTKKVRFSAFESEYPKGSGSFYTNVGVSQDGEKVLDFFNGDVNMPSTQKVRVKGKDQTDFFDIKEYLKLKTIDQYNDRKGSFIPSFSKEEIVKTATVYGDKMSELETLPNVAPPDSKGSADDDLPF